MSMMVWTLIGLELIDCSSIRVTYLLIVCLELNIEAKSEVAFFGDHFTKSQNVVGCFSENNN